MDYNQQKNAEILYIFWILFVILVEKINILLNSYIFIDMYFSLKNPFEPQRNRNLIFMIFSIVTIFCILTHYVINFSIYDFDSFSFYYKVSMQRLLINNYVNTFLRTTLFTFVTFCFIKVIKLFSFLQKTFLCEFPMGVFPRYLFGHGVSR